MITLILISFLTFSPPAQSNTMPATCRSLLPELGPYIDFMENVAVQWLSDSPRNRNIRKIYDALAIRTLYQQTTRDYTNPIDKMIKDFLCRCYFDNDSKTFSARSKIIRDYIDENIDSFIDSATNKYVKLKLRIHEEERARAMSEETLRRVENLKESSMNSVKRRANSLLNKKIRAQERDS